MTAVHKSAPFSPLKFPIYLVAGEILADLEDVGGELPCTVGGQGVFKSPHATGLFEPLPKASSARTAVCRRTNSLGTLYPAHVWPYSLVKRRSVEQQTRNRECKADCDSHDLIPSQS